MPHMISGWLRENGKKKKKWLRLSEKRISELKAKKGKLCGDVEHDREINNELKSL